MSDAAVKFSTVAEAEVQMMIAEINERQLALQNRWGSASASGSHHLGSKAAAGAQIPTLPTQRVPGLWSQTSPPRDKLSPSHGDLLRNSTGYTTGHLKATA